MRKKLKVLLSMLVVGCILLSGFQGCLVFAEDGTTTAAFFSSLANGLYGTDGQQSTDLGKMVAAANTGADFSGGMNLPTYNKLLAQFPGGNKLDGLTPTVKTVTAGYTVEATQYSDWVYDGNVDSGACWQLSLKNAAGEKAPIKESPFQITYDLGQNVVPSVVLLGTTRGGMQVMQYEVYMADSLENLYNAANRVYAYDGTKFEGTNKWGNCVEDWGTWASAANNDGAMLCSAALPAIGQGRYFGLLLTRGDGANNTDTVGIVEMALLEAPAAEELFFGSLANGLYSADGQQSTDNGRMVAAANTGVNFSGGMNNTTYQKLLQMFPGGNKLHGLLPSVDTQEPGYSVEKVTDCLYDWLSDNKVIGSQACMFNLKDASGKAADIPNSPIRLTYDLGKTVTPSVILVGGAAGWNQLMKYEVYMADSLDSLYNAANRVYAYDGFQLLKADGAAATDQWGNYIDPSTYWVTGGERMLCSAVLPNGAKGRYISFVITSGNRANTGNEASANRKVDLVELAVLEAPSKEETFFGSLANGLYGTDGQQSTDNGKMVAAAATGADFSGGMSTATYQKLLQMFPAGNRLNGLTPTVVTADPNVTVTYPDGINFNRVYDGNLAGNSCLQFWLKDAQNQDANIPDSPIQMTYDLGECVKPSVILVGSSRGWYQLTEYEVYLSDSKATLYNEVNRVYTYDASQFEGFNSHSVQNYQAWANGADSQLCSVALPASCQGRYFGLKLKNGNRATGKYRLDLGEVAVLGETVETTSEFAFGGASIRTNEQPALRFKYTLNKSAVDGEIVEYGFAALRTALLNGEELVKGGVYNGTAAASGIAYNAAANVQKIVSEDDTFVTFRAALYNIGVSSSNASRVKYSMLGEQYSVRPYVIVEKDGVQQTVYGPTESYAIFEVAKYLEDHQSADESIAADWSAVNSYFTAEDQIADIDGVVTRKAAYDTWKINGSGYTGDLDQQ